MPEAIQNLLYSLSDTNGQLAVAIIVSGGLLLAVLSSFFAIRESEVDWDDDTAPWPLASAESLRGGAEALGDSSHPSVQPISHDGEHV